MPTDELDPDVEAFLGYMAGAVEDNDFVRGVDDEIRREKENPNEEAVFVTYQMKLDEEREEGRQEEIRRGIDVLVKTCRELNLSDEFIAERIAQGYNMSPEEARTFI